MTAVKLPFLKLSVRQRAARKAKSVTITATSTIPATLAVGRHRVTLKAKQWTKLVVPLSRGGTPVLLPVTVTAAGLVTQAAYVVQR